MRDLNTENVIMLCVDGASDTVPLKLEDDKQLVVWLFICLISNLSDG